MDLRKKIMESNRHTHLHQKAGAAEATGLGCKSGSSQFEPHLCLEFTMQAFHSQPQPLTSSALWLSG